MVLNPRFMATSLSTAPHRDAHEVYPLVLDHLPEAPCLPRLFPSTRMYTEGMPCVTLDREKRRLVLDLSPAREGELVDFYEHVLADDLDYFAISEDLAPGFHGLLRVLRDSPPPELKAVRMSIPGPITWALTSTDPSGVPAFYDETMRDIVIKTLVMKARWHEKAVQEALPGVAMVTDFAEPSMSLPTSAVGSGTREDLLAALDEVFGPMKGMAGVHCCANIDWSILTDSKAQWINFDAYAYAEYFALYGDRVKPFLERGGMIAWGIVPVNDAALAGESADSLIDRLEESIQHLVDRGIDRGLIAERSWVTPSCSVASMTKENAVKAYDYTSAVARRMRERYFG